MVGTHELRGGGCQSKPPPPPPPPPPPSLLPLRRPSLPLAASSSSGAIRGVTSGGISGTRVATPSSGQGSGGLNPPSCTPSSRGSAAQRVMMGERAASCCAASCAVRLSSVGVPTNARGPLTLNAASVSTRRSEASSKAVGGRDAHRQAASVIDWTSAAVLSGTPRRASCATAARASAAASRHRPSAFSASVISSAQICQPSARATVFAVTTGSSSIARGERPRTRSNAASECACGSVSVCPSRSRGFWRASASAS